GSGDARGVGYSLGELRDSLYVIYFKAIDDSQQSNNNAIDSLFILVNDSLPNPPPRFTRRTLLRIDSTDTQKLRTFNYLAGQPDTLFSVFEGDSVVATFYGADQDSLQGAISNSAVAFSLLWDDNLLGVPKNGTKTGSKSGFNQFIHRAGTVDTLVADTSSVVDEHGSATSFRIRFQIPYNLATSNEKADSLVVLLSDGNRIVADTFTVKVRNTNRAPIWDNDITSLPPDSAVAYGSTSDIMAMENTQPVEPFTINNNHTDSTNFSNYVYDADFLCGDTRGYPLTYTASSGLKGILIQSTGLNVYTPAEMDTITYKFNVTAHDSNDPDPKSTLQEIIFRVAPAPEIARVEPAYSSINQEFTIYGSGFGLYDITGTYHSKVIFYAPTASGVRQNIEALIISWARDKIVASVPQGVPASQMDVAMGYMVPDTIKVLSAIYGGYDTYPYTVVVDSSSFDNLEVVDITYKSATIRYRTNFSGADSVVVASSSDTLDIHSGDFTYPTFVEYNGDLSLIRSSVDIFYDGTPPADGLHVIELTDLTPNTLYRFFIGSQNALFAADSLRNVNGPYRAKKIDLRLSGGGTLDGNKFLDAFRFRTLPYTTVNGTPFSIQGKVTYSGGNAVNAIVTLKVVDNNSPADTTLPIFATVGADGNWTLNMGNLKTSEGWPFNYGNGDLMLFSFEGGEMGFGEHDTVFSNSQSPMVISDMVLLSYVNYDMELKTGLNLIGVPLNLFKGEPTNAYQFLDRIEGGNPKISRFINATGSQETIIRSGGRYVGSANFPLQIGKGYFVGVSSKSNVELKGRVYNESLPIIVFDGPGLHFVSRPAQSSDKFYSWDAYQILQNVPNVKVVIRFDPTLQKYDQYFKVGTNYAGTNFGIDVGQGYILDISNIPSQWDPNDPGTLLASDRDQSNASSDAEQVIVLNIPADQANKTAATGVTVSNITSAAAVLTWATGDNDPGQLRVSLSDGAQERVVKPETSKLAYAMSYAVVKGLKPSTEYIYRLENSSGLPMNAETQGRFTTAEVGTGLNPYALFGRLVDVKGSAIPGLLVLVRLKSPETGIESGYLSTVSGQDGFWVINLANLKENGMGLPYTWSEGDEIRLTIIGGSFRSVYTSKVQPGSPHNIALDLQSAGAPEENALDKKPVSVSLPKAYSLSQNFPNPFNPSTTITFSIPEQAGHSKVRLDIYNLRGQLVNTLVDRLLDPGNYQVQWDGIDTQGRPVSSGVYFYRLTTQQYKATRKMVILK
ncbi:MAG TPA: T9SS type A sorting domain-containing protein, partial [archaeon]|nr:T9SS type A sorting domain-containing protein [archaeon]